MEKLERKLRNELKHHKELMEQLNMIEPNSVKREEAMTRIYLEARNILKEHVQADTSMEMRQAAVNVLIDFMRLKEEGNFVILP